MRRILTVIVILFTHRISASDDYCLKLLTTGQIDEWRLPDQDYGSIQQTINESTCIIDGESMQINMQDNNFDLGCIKIVAQSVSLNVPNGSKSSALIVNSDGYRNVYFGSRGSVTVNLSLEKFRSLSDVFISVQAKEDFKMDKSFDALGFKVMCYDRTTRKFFKPGECLYQSTPATNKFFNNKFIWFGTGTLCVFALVIWYISRH